MSTPSASGDIDPARVNKLDLLEHLADDLAHEIKNPLHSMVINLEVLRRRVARLDGDASDTLRYVDVLGTELDRVSRRVELLLRLVRPGHRAEQVSLEELLDELRELFELEAARRRVALQVELQSSPRSLALPREPTRQLLLNLVIEVLQGLAPRSVLHLVTRYTDAALELRVEGRPASGADGAPAPVPPAEPGRLAVARALGSRIGATVEEPPPTESPARTLVLRLPRARA